MACVDQRTLLFSNSQAPDAWCTCVNSHWNTIGTMIQRRTIPLALVLRGSPEQPGKLGSTGSTTLYLPNKSQEYLALGKTLDLMVQISEPRTLRQKLWEVGLDRLHLGSGVNDLPRLEDCTGECLFFKHISVSLHELDLHAEDFEISSTESLEDLRCFPSVLVMPICLSKYSQTRRNTTD